MHLDLKETVAIPEGVSVTVDGTAATVKGEKGEITRKIGTKHTPLKVEGQTVVFAAKNGTRNHKRMIKTGMAHLKNMMRGVSEGHTYKLKICAGHFPMNVSMKDGVLEVKNFIGESVPRHLQLMENADVNIDGEIITVTSVEKEVAGNQASAIEKLTKRPGFDMRIFQDGIYITEKDGRPV
ncbi:MAG: 50S ribosomal protein L6 [Candidatus Woesearchaeota archaeon]|nr:50S ribosomal protein L6 [Candidatus Woesearchaeota archaeon]